MRRVAAAVLLLGVAAAAGANCTTDPHSNDYACICDAGCALCSNSSSSACSVCAEGYGMWDARCFDFAADFSHNWKLGALIFFIAAGIQLLVFMRPWNAAPLLWFPWRSVTDPSGGQPSLHPSPDALVDMPEYREFRMLFFSMLLVFLMEFFVLVGYVSYADYPAEPSAAIVVFIAGLISLAQVGGLPLYFGMIASRIQHFLVPQGTYANYICRRSTAAFYATCLKLRCNKPWPFPLPADDVVQWIASMRFSVCFFELCLVIAQCVALSIFSLPPYANVNAVASFAVAIALGIPVNFMLASVQKSMKMRRLATATAAAGRR